MHKSSQCVLVTGAAGFIGFHLSKMLSEVGYRVVGIDNLNSYYEVALKVARLNILKALDNFEFYEIDIADRDKVNSLFKSTRFSYVVNLAAQAGVRYSLVDPFAYLKSNLHGFLNILEACRQYPPLHLIYASSSSVYGANRKMPFSVGDIVDHPVSLYAATKKSNELMAHTYSALYNLPTTGLRFFTVYGPYGRPDMAIYLFTKAILDGKPIDIYNAGKMKRDFTYIDDIVQSIVRLIPKVPQPMKEWDGTRPNSARSFAPYRLFNIGNSEPVELLKFVEILEEKIGKKAVKNFLPIQDGDVTETYADVSDLVKEIGFKPKTPIREGIAKFVDWYVDYHKDARLNN